MKKWLVSARSGKVEGVDTKFVVGSFCSFNEGYCNNYISAIYL